MITPFSVIIYSPNIRFWCNMTIFNLRIVDCSAKPLTEKVFVYHKNTFWSKRQTNKKQFQTGEESPARDCFSCFIIMSELEKVVNW